MKNLLNSIWNVWQAGVFLLFALLLSSCGDEAFDYEHPNVDVFIKQLKNGKLEVATRADGTALMPKFSSDDVERLLDYADDISLITSFPLATMTYATDGKLRLGECVMWTIESIRLGYRASMGCKMVHTDADNYEGIYFLSDAEVKDAATRYRHWWKNRKQAPTMWTINPCFDEPLCGSGYMWW